MKSKKYLYLTVYEHLKSNIDDGTLKRGDWLPSERDIANNFNVDRTTVRKALNLLVENNLISKKTGIGSQVNPKQLHGLKNMPIVMFLPKNIHKNDTISQPHYSSVFKSLHNECQKNNYNLILKAIDKNDDLKKILTNLNCSGFVFTSNIEHKFIDYAAEQKIPSILLNSHNEKVVSISSDNFNGMKLACEHLISLGHKHFAFITGQKGNLSTIERLNGCVCALTENNIKMSEQYIESTFWDSENGYDATMKIIKNAQQMPTAFVAFNDTLAYGCMNALKDYGLKIPDDASVIGFDDIDESKNAVPALTSVKQHVDNLAKVAVSNLKHQFFSEQYESIPLHIKIPCSLIVRESSAKVSTKQASNR